MNEPLLDTIGFIGAVVAVLVDRRRAVPLASLAVALCLAPAAAAFRGGQAWAVLLGAAAAAMILGAGTRALARRLPHRDSLDPLGPLFAPPQELFGPRSLRLVAAVFSIPAASWVSYNVPIGTVSVVRGLLFPVVLVFLCGAIRLLLARTIEDLAVGVAVIALAACGAWFLRGGPDTLVGAVSAAAVAPVAAALAGWLGGRHAGRVDPRRGLRSRPGERDHLPAVSPS